MYQENHRKPQITHLQLTMKCRIWRRAVLSTVGHAPTTILADFAWYARGSAMAALTWVLWKGRNRLQKVGSYQSKFFGPNFVPDVLKKIGERLRAGSEIFATSDFFGKNSASLHRFLWEQKVAKKVKVCKLFSQLSSCTLFMGAKSCEKSLETFTFDNNRAIWSKSLQTFCVANVAEESCTAEKIPVRGSAKS